MNSVARGEALARVEDLVVRRGARTVLDVPYLDVRRGESLAVIGPNGAGKSTLLLALALLVPPSAGRVWFDGERVTHGTDLTRLRRRMAVVFQEPLLVDQSVFDNVALGLRLRGLRGPELERRVTTWLDRLGIAPLTRRSARGLSGGEAQRASLARAFALQPDLLLLDEPFAALDAPTRAGLVDQVGGIVRDMGLTTVVVTHDRDEALTLGDRLAVLINGRLAQVGPPDEVFSAPADVEVAQFVGVETILPGQVVGYADGVVEVRVGPHVVEAVAERRPHGPVLVCLRPEDITLQARPNLPIERAQSTARPGGAGAAGGRSDPRGRRLRFYAHGPGDAALGRGARPRAGPAGRGLIQGQRGPSDRTVVGK